MTTPREDELMNCLGLVLTLLGEDGRAEVRRVLLEFSEDDDCRRALRTMNEVERAFDRLQPEPPRAAD